MSCWIRLLSATGSKYGDDAIGFKTFPLNGVLSAHSAEQYYPECSGTKPSVLITGLEYSHAGRTAVTKGKRPGGGGAWRMSFTLLNFAVCWSFDLGPRLFIGGVMRWGVGRGDERRGGVSLLLHSPPSAPSLSLPGQQFNFHFADWFFIDLTSERGAFVTRERTDTFFILRQLGTSSRVEFRFEVLL